MMRSAANYMKLEPEQTTVVGDTMETDIKGGFYMGFKTILVLSGMTDKENIKYSVFKPDLVVDSVDQIKFPLKWW